IQTHITTSD
ncbi:hypothetical protein SLEP1_g39026, partial [Rubroshorea leprosula]